MMDEDCPPNRGCMVDFPTRHTLCVADDCTRDEDCAGDEVCRVATFGGTIRRCVEAGDRYEGERCRSHSTVRADRCQEGLLCVGGSCGTPCDPAKQSSCPMGRICVDSLDGPACATDDCRKVGCPQDESCIAINATSFACIHRTMGDNCILHPCEDGGVCNVNVVGAAVGFTCAKECQPLQPESCPRGYVCGAGDYGAASICYPACDASDLSACTNIDPRMRCETVSEDQRTWGCVYNTSIRD
jgi:hypothetical protein